MVGRVAQRVGRLGGPRRGRAGDSCAAVAVLGVVLVACGARSGSELDWDGEVSAASGGHVTLGSGGTSSFGGAAASAGSGAQQTSPDACPPAECNVVGDWMFRPSAPSGCVDGAVRLASDGSLFILNRSTWTRVGTYTVCGDRIISPTLSEVLRRFSAFPASCGPGAQLTPQFSCAGIQANVLCNDMLTTVSLNFTPCGG